MKKILPTSFLKTHFQIVCKMNGFHFLFSDSNTNNCKAKIDAITLGTVEIHVYCQTAFFTSVLSNVNDLLSRDV